MNPILGAQYPLNKLSLRTRHVQRIKPHTLLAFQIRSSNRA